MVTPRAEILEKSILNPGMITKLERELIIHYLWFQLFHHLKIVWGSNAHLTHDWFGIKITTQHCIIVKYKHQYKHTKWSLVCVNSNRIMQITIFHYRLVKHQT